MTEFFAQVERDQAALVRRSQVSSTLPSWTEAHSRLQSDGRPCKVNHPPANRVAHSSPQPRVGPRSDVNFK